MKHIALFFALFFCSYCLSAQQIEISTEFYQKLAQSEKRFGKLYKEKIDILKKISIDSLALNKINNYEIEKKRDSLKSKLIEIDKFFKVSKKLQKTNDSLLAIANQYNNNRKKELAINEKEVILKDRIEKLKNDIRTVVYKNKEKSLDSIIQELLVNDTINLSNDKNNVLKNINQVLLVEKNKIVNDKLTDTIAKVKKEILLLENKYLNEKNKNGVNKNNINTLKNTETEKKDVETKINEAKEKIKQQFPIKVTRHLQDKTYNLPKTDALLRYCAEVKNFMVVDSLEIALQRYRKLCTSVIDTKEYKAILSSRYDKKAIENALEKLSSNTSDNQEQIAYYKNLLQNYCKMNKIVALIVKGAESYLPQHPDDAKKVIATFLKEKKEELLNYPYLQNELYKKQQNVQYKVSVVEIDCK